MAEAHLALCPAGTDPAASTTLRLADGRTLSIHRQETDIPSVCIASPLGIAADAVKDLALSPAMLGNGVQGVVTISPAGRDAPTAVEVIRPADPGAAAPPPPLPVDSPLLLLLSARSFGVEERARATRDGNRLEVACGAGTRPAGILLDPGPARMPRMLAASLVLRGEGAEGFGLAIVRPGEDAPDEVVPIQPGEAGLHAQVAAGEWPPTEGPVQVVVTCPAGAARISLSTLVIEPQGEPPAAVPRAAWMWEATRWQEVPDSLLDEAAGFGIDRLFVALDVANGEVSRADRLADFVRRAGERGIAVVAVEGDPAMALSEGRAAALRRAEAIADYQGVMPADARLAGVQYDIEPYLLPEFSSDREGVLEGWAETVQALGQTLDMPIDLVLPFWIADRSDARELLLAPVQNSIGAITVMAYRTTAEAVTTVSEPLLAWGAAHGVPVRIGLEAGPVPDETHRRYEPATTGQLRLVPTGDVTAAVILEEAQNGPEGVTFRLRTETTVPGSLVSFLGDQQKMLDTAEQAKAALAAWESFGGFAFHGLLRI